MLDLEQPDERRRREEEEFHARLEAARIAQEQEEKRAKKQAEYEAKVSAEERAKREAEERADMRDEEIWCLVPPLSTPRAPRVRAANQHTLWLEWPAVPRDARGERRRPGEVQYVVSMQGGFATLIPGVEVMVAYEGKTGPVAPGDAADGDGTTVASRGSTKASTKSSRSKGGGGGASVAAGGAGGGGGDDDETTALATATSAYTGPRVFRGVIKSDNHLDGTFDVEYADGGKEAAVPRRRILPARAPPWRVIYQGTATKYAVEGLVPSDVLAKEPGVLVAANFVVQTLGTEYGWDARAQRVVRSPEPSLRSAVVAASTSNPREVAAEWNSRTRAKIRDAIVLDEESNHVIDCFDNREFSSKGTSDHYT